MDPTTYICTVNMEYKKHHGSPQSAEVDDAVFLGYDAAPLDSRCQAFRSNIVPSSPRVQRSLMKKTRSFETPVNICCRHGVKTPENLNFPYYELPATFT